MRNDTTPTTFYGHGVPRVRPDRGLLVGARLETRLHKTELAAELADRLGGNPEAHRKRLQSFENGARDTLPEAVYREVVDVLAGCLEGSVAERRLALAERLRAA